MNTTAIKTHAALLAAMAALGLANEVLDSSGDGFSLSVGFGAGLLLAFAGILLGGVKSSENVGSTTGSSSAEGPPRFAPARLRSRGRPRLLGPRAVQRVRDGG
jgi:hypothetical protein